MTSTDPYAQARCGCRLIPCTQGQAGTSSTTSSIVVHSTPVDRPAHVQHASAYEQGGRHLAPRAGYGAGVESRERRGADEAMASRGPDHSLRQGLTAGELGEASLSGSSGLSGTRARPRDFGRGGGSRPEEMLATGGQRHTSRAPRGRSAVAGQEYECAARDGIIDEDHGQNGGRERSDREYSDDEENADRAKRPRIYRYVEDRSPQRNRVLVVEDERNLQQHGAVTSGIFVSRFTEIDSVDDRHAQRYRPVDSTNPVDQRSNYQRPSVADETDEEVSRPTLRGGGRLAPPDRTHYLDRPLYRHRRGCPIRRYGRYTSPGYYGERDNPPMPHHNHTDPARRTVWEDLFGGPVDGVSYQYSSRIRDATKRLRRLAYNIVPVFMLAALARSLTVEMLVAVMAVMVTQVYPR